jgi:hypothetical protein
MNPKTREAPLVKEELPAEGDASHCFVYLSILSPARPGPLARPALGPPTNLTGRAWAEILKPAKFFFDPNLA